MKRTFGFAIAALILMFGLSSAAHADTLNFVLNGSTYDSVARTYTYNATVSAPIGNTSAIFLNGDFPFLSGPPTIDDTDFIFNAPFSVSPGGSSTFDAFVVTVPIGTPNGSYFGTFQILGGGPSDQGVIASADFTVRVGNAGTTTVTPEPSSFILLGTGLSGAVAMVRRRRSIA